MDGQSPLLQKGEIGLLWSVLRTIPVQNRVGDYVHCNSRVWNILLKRLLAEFPNPRNAADIRDVDRLRHRTVRVLV